MKKFLVMLSLLLSLATLNAQIPDNLDGRLYRLCKTWGYLKYFSQNQCNKHWDAMLHTAVQQVLSANTNDDFNQAVNDLLNSVDNNVFIQTPPGALPDTNINVENAWINDTVFSQANRDWLTTFSSHIYQSVFNCLVRYNSGIDPFYQTYIDFRKDTMTLPIDYGLEADRLTV